MDVDEVDGLTRSFGRITTADADSLIGQFKQILNESYGDLSEETCAFFLDMNNWNLPAALGCFYDYDAKDMLNVPQMMFVNDVTMGEDESVPPNMRFSKTWRLLNNGKEKWPDGCTLRRVQGDDITYICNHIRVQSANPGQLVIASVDMTSPPNPGVYQSLWRLISPSEVPFGDQIWCIITVEEHSIVDVTQKLADTHCFEEQSENGHKSPANSSSSATFFNVPRLGHVISNRPDRPNFDNGIQFAHNSAIFSTSLCEPSVGMEPCFSSAEQRPLSETNVEATFQMCNSNPIPTMECAVTEFSSRNFSLNCTKNEEDQKKVLPDRTHMNCTDVQNPEKR